MFCRKTSGILRWRRELDEVGALERRLAEQHAVVGQDADRVAVEMREAGDERLAVAGLELVEFGAVDKSGDDLVDVVALAQVGADRAVDAVWIVGCRLLVVRVWRGDSGGRTGNRGHGRSGFFQERLAMISRPIASACSSSSASWSATPLMRAWTLAPPRSSALTSSPVAAFTSGGPPRKIVPVPRTMTVSSLIAGTYAPPAVRRAHHQGDLGDARRPTCGPGCRRCGRSARGRGRHRPGAAGRRRRESTR